jgi:hypothetical protein
MLCGGGKREREGERKMLDKSGRAAVASHRKSRSRVLYCIVGKIPRDWVLRRGIPDAVMR